MFSKPASLRKVLSAFTVVLVAISLCTGLVSAYDRGAAVDYAGFFYDRVASDGVYWTSQWVEGEKVQSKSLFYPPGSRVKPIEDYLDVKRPGEWASTDCAHFVSSAIGSPPDYKGYSGGGLEVPDRADGYGEPGAHKLIRWATGEVGKEVDTVKDLKKGDIIGYEFDEDGRIDHTAVYLGDKKAAAHSPSWKGHWHLGYDPLEFDPTFVHITEEVPPEIPWRPLLGLGVALVTLSGLFLAISG